MKININAKGKLIDILAGEFRDSSRTALKKMVLNGTIRLNGRTVTNPAEVITVEDTLEYVKFHAPAGTADAPFPVLYDDDQMIVVVKPAGLLTYGEKGMAGTSLYRILNEFLRERSRGKERIFVCHRLDREVSGILVFAKNEEIQEKIKGNWKETQKKYYAFVEGRPPRNEDTIKGWLKENQYKKVVSAGESPEAKFAVTHYKVIKERENHTLLEVSIETGRKHQIRVHLAGLGCPIAGDWKYGSKNRALDHIRLHAFYFSMNHPVTGKRLEFSAQVPKGFMTV